MSGDAEGGHALDRQPEPRAPRGVSGSALFVSWITFHGRSEGLARALGITCWFPPGAALPFPFRYFRQWRETTRLLRQVEPEVVFIMQPPPPALWAVCFYARRAGARVVGDLHTGTFDDPRWPWARRLMFRLLRRYGMAIVTNDALREVAEGYGCPSIVLHDIIEARELDLTPFDDSALAGLESGYALVPLAYEYDEPVDELLSAARHAPDVQWVFTGRAPRRVRKAAPPNVVFPGWVSNDDYARLVSHAGVVVAMTKYDRTMQRSAYEALSYARPLVTANTSVLSDYYRDAAQLVPPRGGPIADGVQRALSDTGATIGMAALRTTRIAEQKTALDLVRTWIDGARPLAGDDSRSGQLTD